MEVSTNWWSASTGADVVLIASNLFFLIPSVEAFRRHRWTRAVIYLFIIAASGTYHACNSFSTTCLFQAATHKRIDFFFAQLIIPLTALYIVYFAPRYRFVERIAILLFALLIFVLEITTGVSFFIQIVLAGVSFLIIAVYWVWYASTARLYTGRARLPPYDWEPFFLGILLTLVACSLFATQSQWHPGYWAVHSIWHTNAAIGQYFILRIKPGAPKFALLDAPIK